MNQRRGMRFFPILKKSKSGGEVPAERMMRRGVSRNVIGCFITGGVVFVILVIISIIPFSLSRPVQLDAGRNCQSIGTAYLSYLFSEQHRRQPELVAMPKSVSEFATFLTAAVSEIDDSKLWFIPDDKRLVGWDELPAKILITTDPKSPVADKNFVSAGPKAWAVVVNIPANAGGCYPVMWTRGLSGNRWSKDSPWKGGGGHIFFLNGSVTYLDDTCGDDGKGVFIDFITGQPTSDIRAAIGPGARILEDK